MADGDVLWGVDLRRDKRLERGALRRMLGAVGLALLIFLLAAKSTSLPVTLLRLYWTSHGVEITPSMAQLVNMASYTASLLLPLLFFVLAWGPRAGRPLFPLVRPRKGTLLPALGVCLGVCSLSNYLSSWLAMMIQRNFPQTLPSYRADIPTQGTVPMVLGVISAAVLPAVLEELLFRGAILQGARGFGDGFAVFVSALSFALCHTTIPQLLPALLAGLLFGFFTLQSGSLWVTIFIHCCYNLLAVAVELAGTLRGAEVQLMVSVSIAAGSLMCCIAGTVVLLCRLRDRGTELEPYRGALTLPERLAGMGCNIPYLVAAATLCWTTWSPVLEGVLGKWT